MTKELSAVLMFSEGSSGSRSWLPMLILPHVSNMTVVIVPGSNNSKLFLAASRLRASNLPASP